MHLCTINNFEVQCCYMHRNLAVKAVLECLFPIAQFFKKNHINAKIYKCQNILCQNKA